MVWCRVTRHPRIFDRLTGCQRTPGIGVSQIPFTVFLNNTSSIKSVSVWNSKIIKERKKREKKRGKVKRKKI